MIVDRLIAPRSELGFVCAVDDGTRRHHIERSAAAGRGEGAGANEALDWLLSQQTRIENRLARRHLRDGVLVLYDVSSQYFEGRCCTLAQHGYSRDHRSDRSHVHPVRSAGYGRGV